MRNNSKNYTQDFKKFLETLYQSWQTMNLTVFEKQKKELDSHRPLSKLALKSLEEKLEVDEVHNSTAIEGNSLTLGETELVLTKGLTVAGKPLKDHLEVKSYDRAYHYIKSIYQKAKEIDEKIILETHRLVFADFTEDLKKQLNHGIGVYRKQAVFIRGSDFVPPNYIKIPALIKIFMNYINSIKNNTLIKAVLAHLGLVTIHPFIDGNGRTARLLMNLILFQGNWPIIIVKKEQRADYLNNLNKAQNNPQSIEFFQLMLKFLQQSFDLYKELY